MRSNQTVLDKIGEEKKLQFVVLQVPVNFPDPWERPPAGEWVWENETTAVLKP